MYLSDIIASVLSWPKLQTTLRVAYATSTFPMMHLIYPPPPPPPKKQILHTSVPREIENNAYAKFGGGGQIRCIMGNVEVANKNECATRNEYAHDEYASSFLSVISSTAVPRELRFS